MTLDVYRGCETTTQPQQQLRITWHTSLPFSGDTSFSSIEVRAIFGIIANSLDVGELKES